MILHRFNWQIWAGFLLSIAALISYPFVFVWFPVTRDFPWANLLLLAAAAALLVLGIRRTYGPGGSRAAKIFSVVLATLSVAILALFIFTAFVMSRWLPASHGAPKVGQKAPDFSL